jgi:hypothetical protein
MEEEKTVQSVRSHQWRLMPMKSCFLSMEEKARGNNTTPKSEATTIEGNNTTKLVQQFFEMVNIIKLSHPQNGIMLQLINMGSLKYKIYQISN